MTSSYARGALIAGDRSRPSRGRCRPTWRTPPTDASLFRDGEIRQGGCRLPPNASIAEVSLLRDSNPIHRGLWTVGPSPSAEVSRGRVSGKRSRRSAPQKRPGRGRRNPHLTPSAAPLVALCGKPETTAQRSRPARRPPRGPALTSACRRSPCTSRTRSRPPRRSASTSCDGSRPGSGSPSSSSSPSCSPARSRGRSS